MKCTHNAPPSSPYRGAPGRVPTAPPTAAAAPSSHSFCGELRLCVCVYVCKGDPSPQLNARAATSPKKRKSHETTALHARTSSPGRRAPCVWLDGVAHADNAGELPPIRPGVPALEPEPAPFATRESHGAVPSPPSAHGPAASILIHLFLYLRAVIVSSLFCVRPCHRLAHVCPLRHGSSRRPCRRC